MSNFAFGVRLQTEFQAGRRLCVGIDPHEFLLAEWGLPNTASGAEQFGLAVVEASIGVAAAIKPQVAFFERFGSAGFQALEHVFVASREAGILLIADAKRGDVGSSFDAYADAWLMPGSPLEADAMTASVFQGFGVLDRALQHATEHGKGVFVLAATSNPEARTIQTAQIETGVSVSEHVLESIHQFNSAHFGSAPVGNVGAVLGATVDLTSYGITLNANAQEPMLPVLAPGFGHQGGSIQDAQTRFGSYFESVLVSESRSVLTGGGDGLRDRIRVRADDLEQFWGVG